LKTPFIKKFQGRREDKKKKLQKKRTAQQEGTEKKEPIRGSLGLRKDEKSSRWRAGCRCPKIKKG